MNLCYYLSTSQQKTDLEGAENTDQALSNPAGGISEAAYTDFTQSDPSGQDTDGVFIMDELKPITLAALAAITGIFGAVLILAISWLAGWPWVYSLVGLAAISAITWLALMRRYLGMCKGSSTATFAPSKVYPTTTRIEITAKDPSGVYQHGKFADLPVDLGTLAEIARRINAGSSFSHAGLAGPGRPLSRSEYEVLRDVMISRGLCYWINPNAHAQGCKLTRAGEAVLRHFVGRNDPVTSYLPQLNNLGLQTHISPGNAHAYTRTRGNGREVDYRQLTPLKKRSA